MTATGHEIVYAGRIVEGRHGENDDALFLEGSDGRGDPFAEQIQDDLEEHGRYVTARYYLSDEERSTDQLLENQIRLLAGVAEADYSDYYSEYTGYLWTDEECVIGGHDLLAELLSNVGRYCHLTVTFYREAPGGQ